MCIALYGKPITELLSVTCHKGSHSATWHPTQVNTLHCNLTPAKQAGEMICSQQCWFWPR